MGSTGTGSKVREQALLEAARAGDEGAFRELVDSRRAELQAHCYRMLGSVHDAEDALQDAMLRAWRGLPRFEGRSSLRSWLYRIATNACVDIIARRPKRTLPAEHGPKFDPEEGPREPIVERIWIEPFPDEELGIPDGYASPDARYEQRESVELAFVAALQHLPANQRAALIMREVLGFSAKETAATLGTTTASVNSALQRARENVEGRLPESSQQETLRTLGDEKVRETVQGYLDAWMRSDVDEVVSRLTEDAAFAMPPMASWFGGREEIATFLHGYPLSGKWRWRALPARANGQPALAFYTWEEDEGCFVPFALNVLELRGELIHQVVAFIARSGAGADPVQLEHLPERPYDERQLEAAFGRFGLPERLDATDESGASARS